MLIIMPRILVTWQIDEDNFIGFLDDVQSLASHFTERRTIQRISPYLTFFT